MILTIRTDKPEAEVGLLSIDGEEIVTKTWQAHRALSDTIHLMIQELLDSQKKSWQDVEVIFFYKGPGSFTGLRIGASVANALASANEIAIVGVTGDSWVADGRAAFKAGNTGSRVLPEYGAEPFTTSPRK